MATWVVSPFVALLWASVASKLWSAPARVALYVLMLLVSLSSLAIYEADALWPRGSQAAFVFIAVPPASWLLSALAVSLVAFIFGRRSRRFDGG
jgi:hypothetical protein